MRPHRELAQVASENEKPISKLRKLENGNEQKGIIESPRSCVIKRNKESIINFYDHSDIKRTTSCSLRVSDKMIESDADFIISLSGLNDGVYI